SFHAPTSASMDSRTESAIRVLYTQHVYSGADMRCEVDYRVIRHHALDPLEGSSTVLEGPESAKSYGPRSRSSWDAQIEDPTFYKVRSETADTASLTIIEG